MSMLLHGCVREQSGADVRDRETQLTAEAERITIGRRLEVVGDNLIVLFDFVGVGFDIHIDASIRPAASEAHAGFFLGVIGLGDFRIGGGQARQPGMGQFIDTARHRTPQV